MSSAKDTSQVYYFGRGDKRRYPDPKSKRGGTIEVKQPVWTLRANSLSAAVRAFRVGASFPHSYSDAPLEVFDLHPERDRYGIAVPRWGASEPGAKVPVFVIDGKVKKFAEAPDGTHVVDGKRVPFYRWWMADNYVLVDEIDPEGPVADECFLKLLPSGLQRMIGAPGSGEEASTAMAVSEGGVLAGMNSASRRELDSKRFDLAAKQAELVKMKRELEMAKRDLELQMAALEKEVKRRLDQIWAIELFIGSKEQVHCLAEGTPAPLGTPITVLQRVLCMDEEIAVHDWLTNPERIGDFGAENLAEFDRWVVSSPSVRKQLFPHEKGIVGLRVRRQGRVKDGRRFTFEANDPDQRTYLLVFNGENVYRLWADVDLWPRFFPRAREFDWLRDGRHVMAGDKERAEAEMKMFTGGLVVIQGLIERSDLFHPIRPGVDVFNPLRFDEDFVAVRDAESEGRMLLTGGDESEHWGWVRYRKWLASKVQVGVRVLWDGRQDSSGRSTMTFEEERTGMRTVRSIPGRNTPHTVTETWEHGTTWSGMAGAFKYLPDDHVWRRDPFGFEYSTERTRRVTWRYYGGEVMPVDYVSWRVMERLIKDRYEREHYNEFMYFAFKWWGWAKKQSLRDAAFVTLVLTQAGDDHQEDKNRARVERLIRWWRMKTKQHRDLSTDEPKALRMILKAYRDGKDGDDPAEKELFG